MTRKAMAKAAPMIAGTGGNAFPTKSRAAIFGVSFNPRANETIPALK